MSDPVAIVTGGSRGAGRALARDLAGEGYAVAVVYVRDQHAAEAAVDTGAAALAIRADVTDELDVERLFDETVAVFGSVDLVVHAAPCDGALLEHQAARRARAFVDRRRG